MKTIVAFAALLAVAVALPPGRVARAGPADVLVVEETPQNNIGVDGYLFNYRLSDGQTRDETSQVEIRGAEDAVNRVRGSFSFVADDGQTYSITYVADENGFQPQGAHIPVPPAV